MDKALFVGNIFSSTLSLPIGQKSAIGGGIELAIYSVIAKVCATRLSMRYAIEVCATRLSMRYAIEYALRTMRYVAYNHNIDYLSIYYTSE